MWRGVLSAAVGGVGEGCRTEVEGGPAMWVKQGQIQVVQTPGLFLIQIGDRSISTQGTAPLAPKALPYPPI